MAAHEASSAAPFTQGIIFNYFPFLGLIRAGIFDFLNPRWPNGHPAGLVSPLFSPMKMPDFAAILSSVRSTPFLGKAIVYFRAQRGMTQPQLAKAAGTDLSAIKRLEKGRKRGGGAATLEVVCKALGISVNQLFDRAYQIAVAEEMETVFLQFARVAS